MNGSGISIIGFDIDKGCWMAFKRENPALESILANIFIDG